MSNYFATDAEFISVADAIRIRGGTSAPLEWPTDFVNAILAIPTGGKSLTSISAVFSQGSTVVYDTDSLDSLKTMLVVTANYSDSTTETVPSTDYTLTGTLSAGISTITVVYLWKTSTFNVAVTATPIDLLNVTWANHAITCGQDTNNYNAWSPHNLQYDSVNDCFVFLQCHTDRHVNWTASNWTLTLINPYDSTDYTAIAVPEFNGLGMLFVENGVWTLMPRNQSFAYRSSDKGVTWETLTANIPNYLFGVYKCGGTYFGGDDKNSGLTYYVSSDLLNWTAKTFDSSLGYTTLCETTFCDFDGKYWAFNRTNDADLGHPVILQSSDQGATWTLFSDQMLHGYRSTVSCYPFQNYIMVADIDRDNGVLYYNKFDGTTFTELNSWQVPYGGDDFHNVNIASNYKDIVILEFMHAAPFNKIRQTGVYAADYNCDNVMLVGSTKTLPSFNFDSYIDTYADMFAYANANWTSGLNGGIYEYEYAYTGGPVRIKGSNAITSFVDEVALPLNLMQVDRTTNSTLFATFKNGDSLASPWNTDYVFPHDTMSYSSLSATSYVGIVEIKGIRYVYGFNGHTNELPVLIRTEYLKALTQYSPTSTQNNITGESWQEEIGFRRVISINPLNNGSQIVPFAKQIFDNGTAAHKFAFISYTPISS